MKIICISMTSNPKNSFVGNCDLHFTELYMTIKNCTMWQKNGKRWVNTPQKSYVNEKGSRVYEAFVEFTSPEMKKEFNEQALKAVDKYCEKVNAAN